MSSNLKKTILVDLDGTLTNCDHRVHFLYPKVGGKKDWKSFYEAMGDDEIHLWCHELMIAMQKQGYGIVFVTGRDENYRDLTTAWLEKHNVSYDELHMRKFGDHRDDYLVKEEIYNSEIKPRMNVLFVVDDRKSVVEKWRQLGLVCLQCAEGNF